MGSRGGGSVLHDALEGLRYVTRHPGIGPLLLFAATVGMTLRAVGEMLPPYVSLLFGRGAEGLATLASTMGCAAMAGGFLVAIRGRISGLARIAVGCGMLLALATAGFVATRWFPVGVACIAAMGAATTMHGISCQTLMQNSAVAGDGGAGAEPVGNDHAGRPGDGRADLWRGGRGVRIAHSGADRRGDLSRDVGADVAAAGPAGAGAGRDRGAGAVTKEAPGRCPGPHQEASASLDLRQGRWPLEPFILAVEQEGPTVTLQGPVGPSCSTTNGQIAKGLALCWGSRGQSPWRVRGQRPRVPWAQPPPLIVSTVPVV